MVNSDVLIRCFFTRSSVVDGIRSYRPKHKITYVDMP